LGNVFWFESFFQFHKANGRSIGPLGIRLEASQGDHPRVACLKPAGFVKDNPRRKVPFLGGNLEAGGSSQTCELADAELTDSVSPKSGR
jgi:hypothetical protein